MSLMWLDDTDVESAEYDDSEPESFDDSDTEDYGDEQPRSAAARRRRIQQQRLALARRRQAQARGRFADRPRRSAVVEPARQQQTAAAIQNLDLDTKVQGDTLRGMIAAQNRRMSRGEWAAVAGAATGQFIESFDEPDDPYIRAAVRFAPLLLLEPRKTGSGMESFARDPRVIGAAAVAAITFAGDRRNQSKNVFRIELIGPDDIPLAGGVTDRFLADAFDRRGALVATNVVWNTEDITGQVTIDATGKVTPVKQGFVYISATLDGITRRTRLEVT